MLFACVLCFDLLSQVLQNVLKQQEKTVRKSDAASGTDLITAQLLQNRPTHTRTRKREKQGKKGLKQWDCRVRLIIGLSLVFKVTCS